MLMTNEERAGRQVVVARLLAPRDLLGAGQALAAIFLRPGDAGEPGIVELGLEGFLLRERGLATGLFVVASRPGAGR